MIKTITDEKEITAAYRRGVATEAGIVSLSMEDFEELTSRCRPLLAVTVEEPAARATTGRHHPLHRLQTRQRPPHGRAARHERRIGQMLRRRSQHPLGSEGIRRTRKRAGRLPLCVRKKGLRLFPPSPLLGRGRESLGHFFQPVHHLTSNSVSI